MITFLKNFTARLSRKKIFFFLVILVFCSLFLPLPALAQWTLIGNALMALPTMAAILILTMGIHGTQAIAFVMGAILDWVISPGFVSLSYTRPCPSTLPNCNQIITMGLNITQNFVNLLLVVILVYIALSIALRIGEHDAKKVFGRLIIIALLVNFAPVFCGLIVDAANIIMNYFLEPIRGGVSGALLQSSSLNESIAKLISLAGAELSTRLGLLAMGCAAIFMNLCFAFVFFLFAGLFIFRYVAIWVLVILAPLAFVSWILPATKRFWDMWWNNFLQWSIIGIPAAFFLYLGIGSYSAITDTFYANLAMPEIEPVAVGFFNQMFPFFVTVAFLLLGFLIGLSSSAMGASTVMAYTKTAGKWVGRIAGGGGIKILQKTGLAERMTKQATARLPGFKGKSWGGKIATGLGYATGAIPAYWATRRGMGAAGVKMAETERAAIHKEEGTLKGTIPEAKASALRAPLSPTRRIAALRQAIEEGQVGDVKKLLGHTGGMNLVKDKEVDDEIVKIGKAALRVNPEEFKKIRDAFPHLAEKMGEGVSESIREKAGLTLTTAEQATGITIPMKITARIKPSFVSQMDKDALKNNHVKVGIHNNWTGAHLSQLDKESLDEFCDDAVSLFGGMPWYRANNPRLHTYLQSSAARGLGIEIP